MTSDRIATTGFTASEHLAIERFLTCRTVPLTYETNGTAFVQGTGSFYRSNGELFLVTAAHVLEGIDAGRLGVPDRPGGNVVVWQLGEVTVHHPQDSESFDVAVIELDPKFRERVAGNWDYIDEAEVQDTADETSEFVVAGYPTEKVQNLNGVLTPEPMLQLFTSKCETEVEENTPEYDTLLKYPFGGAGIFGGQRSTPKLQGVSGALVYGRFPPNHVWAVPDILRPVGIQVSMKRGDFIRVKQWGLVQRLIDLVREQRGA